MKTSDAKIIEFFGKSPIWSFETIRDVLRYLEGNWIPEDVEHELFDDGILGGEVQVPNIGGATAAALYGLTRVCEEFHFVRRRPREVRDDKGKPEDIIVFFEVTPAGKEMICILDAIQKAKQ